MCNEAKEHVKVIIVTIDPFRIIIIKIGHAKYMYSNRQI
jgi:hypothetical protein